MISLEKGRLCYENSTLMSKERCCRKKGVSFLNYVAKTVCRASGVVWEVSIGVL